MKKCCLCNGNGGWEDGIGPNAEPVPCPECNVKKCYKCGDDKAMLFPVRNEGTHVCDKCLKVWTPDALKVHNEIVEEGKEYLLRWKLRDAASGKVWIEEHHGMTLADFEVLYGNNVYEFVWVTLVKKGHAIL